MLDPETRAFLESGCALLVGTVAPDGAPHASRGWGITVLQEDPLEVRLLVDAGDAPTVEHLAGGGAVAITAANVRDLRSMQLKGRARGVEAVTPADHERAAAFCDDFFAAIVETDGTSLALCERLVPVGYAVAIVELHERFDQTPGPGAGARVGSAS